MTLILQIDHLSSHTFRNSLASSIHPPLFTVRHSLKVPLIDPSAWVKEDRVSKWKQFGSYLDKKERKTFDQMYDYYKLNIGACRNARRPVRSTCRHYVNIFEHYGQRYY